METVKKIYEEPTVQKVEFDFKTRIAASGCIHYNDMQCPTDAVNS